MTIAYDLRYASDHFTGIGRHTFALLDALLELPGDERYQVLWDPRLRQTRFDFAPIARHPRVDWHEARLDPLGVAGLLGTAAWLRRVRPDVYFSPFHLLPPFAGCPCVLMIHDVHPLRLPGEMGPKGRWFYRLSLMLASRARLVVTCSQFSSREIVELLHLPQAQVRVARQGVAPIGREITPRRPAALVADRFALIVGENRPRKNLVVLARAWARFGKDAPLGLVWAGGSLERHASLAQLASEAGVSGIQQLGWVDEEELVWLYRNAEMVLFPSRYEGFGFPLVEAFANGAPAVVSDIPPFREIGEGAARFVAPDDVEGWVRAIREVAGDANERERMRRAGAAWAAQLTYARTAERVLACLREAVA
jgi:glycosyltransferase involved in cell wall biosynthesis